MIDHQYLFNGVTLGVSTDYDIETVTGLDIPEIRNSDEVRSFDHGYFQGQDLLGGRIIEITHSIFGEDRTALELNLAALRRAMAVQDEELPLSFQLPEQIAKRVYVKPRKANFSFDQVRYVLAGIITDSALQFFATDPRIYQDELQTLTILAPTAEGGSTFPWTFPLSFGAPSVGGYGDVENVGTFPTRPVMSINGPISNPSIQNVSVESRPKLSFDITLSPSDRLEIDFDAHSILLNGSASRRNKLRNGSEWFDLVPGTNRIRFRGNGSGNLEINWRSAWL